MRLVVDASVLIGELLRKAGRKRLADPRLELFLSVDTQGEVRHEIPRRVSAFARQRAIPEAEADELVRLCLAAVQANLTVIDQAVYAPLEDEARARALRDPRDWPLVACALVLDAGIWTHERDLLGVGVATWMTETLRSWMERNPSKST